MAIQAVKVPNGVFSIPVSKLSHLLYCPRKFYMEMHYSPKKRSKNTKSAIPKRKPVKKPSYNLPVTRAIDLQVKTLMLNGRVRILDSVQDKAVPVITQSKRDDSARRESDMKASAYALMLRDADYRCDEYIVSFKGNNTSYAIDQRMLDATMSLIHKAKKIITDREEPAGTSGIYCNYCRFRSSCNSTIQLSKQINKEQIVKQSISVNLYTVEELLDSPPVIRDTLPMYVRSQGSQVGINGGSIIVTKKDKQLAKTLVTDVSQICLMGNVQITSQCLRRVMQKEIPVSFFTLSGAFCGTAQGLSYKNAHYRRAQYLSLTNSKPMEISRVLVSAKLLNQRTFLKKRSKSAKISIVNDLAKLAKRALTANSSDELRGYEGAGASLYFSEFPNLLQTTRNKDEISFDTRNRRPPKDPINAMLSFGYMLLTKEVTVAIESVGLDSMQGFFHTSRNRRPALALDLMEPLRPALVDSVVIGMVKRGQVRLNDFSKEGNGILMTSTFRKKFIASWEKRLQQPWAIEDKKTDCRGMISQLVKDLVSYLLGRHEGFKVPVFR